MANSIFVDHYVLSLLLNTDYVYTRFDVEFYILSASILLVITIVKHLTVKYIFVCDTDADLQMKKFHLHLYTVSQKH